MAIAIAVCGCLLDPPNADGSRTWTQVSSSGAPGPMHGAKLTWDGNRQKVVMYTGRNDHDMTMPGQVYEWSERQWTPICAPSTSEQPPPVFLPGFAWNPKLQALMLVGGALDFALQTPTADVWTCGTDNVWQKRTSITTPRVGAQLVWQEGQQKMFVIGGRDSAGKALRNMEFSDDPTSWTQMQSDPNDGIPVAGTGESATYDDNTHRIIALAGVLRNATDPDELHDELWQMSDDSGRGFEQFCGPCRGSVAANGSVVHFGGTAENWIFGGYIGGNHELPGTWLLDNDKPIKVINDQLRDRAGVGAAFDVVRKRIVAFGGSGTSCSTTNFECGETYELQ